MVSSFLTSHSTQPRSFRGRGLFQLGTTTWNLIKKWFNAHQFLTGICLLTHIHQLLGFYRFPSFSPKLPIMDRKKASVSVCHGFHKTHVFGFRSDTVTALFTVVNLIIDQRHSQLTSMLFMWSVVRIVDIWTIVNCFAAAIHKPLRWWWFVSSLCRLSFSWISSNNFCTRKTRCPTTDPHYGIFKCYHYASYTSNILYKADQWEKKSCWEADYTLMTTTTLSYIKINKKT